MVIKIFVITGFNNITSSLNNYDRYYLPIIIIHLTVNWSVQVIHDTYVPSYLLANTSNCNYNIHILHITYIGIIEYKKLSSKEVDEPDEAYKLLT